MFAFFASFNLQLSLFSSHFPFLDPLVWSNAGMSSRYKYVSSTRSDTSIGGAQDQMQCREEKQVQTYFFKDARCTECARPGAENLQTFFPPYNSENPWTSQYNKLGWD